MLAFLRGQVLGPLVLQAAGARPSGVRRLETGGAGMGARDASDDRGAHRGSCAAALRAAAQMYRALRAERPRRSWCGGRTRRRRPWPISTTSSGGRDEPCARVVAAVAVAAAAIGNGRSAPYRPPFGPWSRLNGGNPILEPQRSGLEVSGVFNPAVVKHERPLRDALPRAGRAEDLAPPAGDQPRRHPFRAGRGARARSRRPSTSGRAESKTRGS